MIEPGTRLGPYEVTGKLGEGGMGEVYRATDTQLDRQVAIKVLPAAFTADEERLARFEREAKVLAQLHHPNIASIFGLAEGDGARALVMELVEGPTLADRLENGALPLEESLSIARQIAEALEEAHEKGIVHRDLKPQNIKASLEGKVKVLDFGLAKAMDPMGTASGSGSASQLAHSPTLTLGATVQGVILGTAAYMSPEQAKGMAVDKRADIWAFGVVLHEMLTGTRLFAADTVPETLAGVISREIDLAALPKKVPPPIRRLLRRCLERQPRNRLHSMADARIVIDDVLAGRVEEPAPAQAAGRKGLAWTIALPALVAAALAGVLAGRSSAPEAALPTPVRMQRLTSSGSDHQPSASPDGRFVAFTSSRDGTPRIWLKQMEGGGEQSLTDGPDFLPRFTPDGNSVGFLRQQAIDRFDFYRTALVGGQVRRLVEDVASYDWSPDGRSAVFVRSPRRPDEVELSDLVVVDLETGRERQLLQLEGWLLAEPRWSPDGRRVAVTRGGAVGAAGGWKILLVDVASGESREVVAGDGLGVLSSTAWDARGEGLYYAASSDNVGDLTGKPSELRHVVPGGAPRTLFWASGLFPFRGSGAASAILSPLGPRSLVFDTWEQRQSLVEVDLRDGTERSLTESLASDRQPAYSPDGRSIVFSSNRTGNLDLWVLDRGSGRLRQITDDPAPDWDPGFSPDGSRILFSSGRGLESLEIWSIGLDGSDARQITNDGVDAENPTMTSDGRWIVYTSGNTEHLGIWRIHPDGTGATRLTEGNHTNGEVSPDGRWALYVSSRELGGQVKFVEVETGRLAPVSMFAAAGGREPSITLGRARWLPDGSGVVFVGLDDEGRTGLFAQDFDPERDTVATRRKLAGFLDRRKSESFGISPDGSRLTLAYARETRVLTVAEGLPE